MIINRIRGKGGPARANQAANGTSVAGVLLMTVLDIKTVIWNILRGQYCV